MDKKLERYDVLLRRILGFNIPLEKLSAQMTQVDKGILDLLDNAYPQEDDYLTTVKDDEGDEMCTQYDNEAHYIDSLGTGPPPSLFSSSKSSLHPKVSSPITSPSPFPVTSSSSKVSSAVDSPITVDALWEA